MTDDGTRRNGPDDTRILAFPVSAVGDAPDFAAGLETVRDAAWHLGTADGRAGRPPRRTPPVGDARFRRAWAAGYRAGYRSGPGVALAAGGWCRSAA